MDIEVVVSGEAITVTSEERNLAVPTFGELAINLGARRPRGSYLFSEEGTQVNSRGGARPLRELLGQGFTAERIASTVAESILNLYQARHSPAIVRFTLTHTQSSLRTLPPQGGFVVMDGTVYHLTAVEDTDASSAVEFMERRTQEEQENLVRAYNQALARNAQELEGRIREAEVRALQGRLPPIPLDLVKAGLLAWSHEDFLCFSLPFLYSPKYISQTVGHSEEMREIPPTRAREMVKALRVIFMTDTSLHLRSISLFQEDLGSEFDHYHRRCWGSYRFPEGSISLSELPSIRDQLQRVLEVINLSSVAYPQPEGYPHVSRVWENSTPTTAIDWDTRRRETPVPRGEGQQEPEPSPGWRV